VAVVIAREASGQSYRVKEEITIGGVLQGRRAGCHQQDAADRAVLGLAAAGSRVADCRCSRCQRGDRVLLDRELYIPQAWIDDGPRCAEAGTPADHPFATRPAQVIAMIKRAREAGVPFAWFTADEEFGQNSGVRAYLEETSTSYVMSIPKNTEITTASGTTATIENIAGKLNQTAWQRRACGIGAKGFRACDWALISSATTCHQYMIRSSMETGELAYYHCHNPRGEGFAQLVQVAGARWPIEECFPKPGIRKSPSTTTKSASTAPGTGTSPSPCSPIPTSPFSQLTPKDDMLRRGS
jgi:hypothetical protein